MRRRCRLLFVLPVLLLLASCEKEDLTGLWATNDAYCSNISCISAKVVGKAISPKRLSSEIVFSLEYSTSKDFTRPEIAHINKKDLSEDQSYTLFLTGLSPSTTYYFRNDVLYEGEHHYGRIADFTTKPVSSLISTQPASDISLREARLNGTCDLTDVICSSSKFGFLYGISREQLYNEGGCHRN